jgi:ClpP class serine protease
MTAGLWLCDALIARQIDDARARATGDVMAQSAAFAERDESPLLRVESGVASIPIVGVLTKRPDFFASFFGGGNTTYASIRRALATAAGDPAVKSIVLDVDSPGGSVDGLFEALDFIDSIRRGSSKTMLAVAENAQSAAYGLAAAAGRIEARGTGSTLGSIGTAASFYVSDAIVTLTNTDSPDKRPDLRTPEGKAVVVKYLDQLNEVFVGAIARGRGISAQQVRNGYGRGASMTAQHASTLGMIDAIQGQASSSGGARAASEPAAALAASWDPFAEAERATRLALRAGAAFDERRARDGARAPAGAPAPVPTGRDWVRP